jgi:membrane protein implicated in regulation of membrane protease activity
MSFWQGLDYYHWLLLGLLLLVIEVMAGGGFLMWLGFSALATGLLVLVLPWLHLALSWEWQLAVFAVGCVLAVAIWWKFFHWTVPAPESSSLNRRGSDLVGRETQLRGALVNGVGHVMIDGVRWQVSGPDLPDGARVRLLRQDDLIFVVEAVD